MGGAQWKGVPSGVGRQIRPSPHDGWRTPGNTLELSDRNDLVLNPSKATLSSEDLARKQGKRFHLRVVREQQFQLMPLRWGAPEDQSRSVFNSRPCEGGE